MAPAAYSERISPLADVIEGIRSGFFTSIGYASVAQKVFVNGDTTPFGQLAIGTAVSAGKTNKLRGKRKSAKSLTFLDNEYEEEELFKDYDEYDDTPSRPRLGEKRAGFADPPTPTAKEGEDVSGLAGRLRQLEIAHTNLQSSQLGQSSRPQSGPRRSACYWCGGPHLRRECHSFTQALREQKIRIGERGIPTYTRPNTVVPRDPEGFPNQKAWFMEQEMRGGDEASSLRQSKSSKVLWEPPAIEVSKGSFQTRMIEASPRDGYESEYEFDIYTQKREREDKGSPNPSSRTRRGEDATPTYQPPRMRVEADDPPRGRVPQPTRAEQADVDMRARKGEPQSRTTAAIGDATDGKQVVDSVLKQEVSLPIAHKALMRARLW